MWLLTASCAFLKHRVPRLLNRFFEIHLSVAISFELFNLKLARFTRLTQSAFLYNQDTILQVIYVDHAFAKLCVL